MKILMPVLKSLVATALSLPEAAHLRERIGIAYMGLRTFRLFCGSR
jgi:hypothetical protein